MMIHYKDFDFRRLKLDIYEKKSKKKVEYYSNDIFCFDIEVSSYFVDEDNEVYSLNDV